MRALSYALASIFGGICIVFAINIGILTIPERLVPKGSVFELNLNYTDFLTVMFAGTTLVLAALAIFVGLVAFFTYQGIKDEASRSIESAVEKKAPELHGKIEKQSQELFDSKAAELDDQIQQYIQEALERAGRDGKLDEALQRALVSINMGFGTFAREVSQDPEN